MEVDLGDVCFTPRAEMALFAAGLDMAVMFGAAILRVESITWGIVTGVVVVGAG